MIDFADFPLEGAVMYPAALSILRAHVKPERDSNSRKVRREQWWKFGEKALGMRKAIDSKPRWIGSLAFGKRLLLSWQEPWTCPSGKIYVFAFDDDYSMGVLLSRAHDAWAWAQSSTLETRLRYTPTSVFETFPWPEPTDAQRDKIAAASAALYERRSALCIEHNMGPKLYNLMDEGGFQDLKKLHKDLDEAVAEAYGWPKSVAQDNAELVTRLRALNRDVAEGKRPYSPFG